MKMDSQQTNHLLHNLDMFFFLSHKPNIFALKIAYFPFILKSSSSKGGQYGLTMATTIQHS